ncbi:MAG: dihydrolipoyl dehydrogenase [Thermoprotei archaeon]
MTSVDVLVIGGGGGGYPGAFRLSKAGYSVMMVDPKGVLGGNCLYSGCVPSKTVREMCLLAARARRFLRIEPPNSFFREVQKHKDEVQEIRFEQHREEIEENGTEYVKGEVQVKGPRNYLVKTEDKELEVSARYAVIATGTEVERPPIPGAELAITSDDIFSYHPSIVDLPDELVIVGGGYIAFEVASMLNALGTKVHVLVRSDRALREVDKRLVDMFLAALDKEIDVKFNAPTLAIEKRGNRVAAIYSSGSTKNEVSGQHVLVATGRRPVVPKGLEAVLQLNRGFVPTNDGMETAIPGLFATGDVTGKSTYFHAAVRESLVAAHNIMAGGTMIDYMNLRDIPVAIFTFPPMAYVGITPQLASKIGIRLLEVSYPLKRDVMAQVYDERVGEVRIFVDRDNMRVVGGWVLGEDAPDVINEIALAAQSGLNLKDLAEFAGQHPVPFEDISYAARSAL